MEDLVRPRAPDAGDHALVAEHRVQPSRFGCADLGEPLRADAERLGPEVGELLLPLPPGLSSQTPARFFAPASVSTSRAPPSKTSWNAGVFGPVSPALRYFKRPAVIRCTSTHELAVGRREEQPLRAPLRARELPPSSADSGGSNVFSVAMCAGPAFTIGNAETGSSSARRQASISGSSGTQLAFRLQRIDPIRVAVRRGGVVEAIHRVHARRGAGRAVIAEAGDSGARRLHALLVQAAPGAPARARPRRPRRARSRDRLGVTSRRRRAARGRARAARQGAGERGRARVRARGRAAVAAQAQLLGQARRHARALPGEGLAKRGLPARGPPRAAGDARRRTPRRRRSPRTRSGPASTAAASSPSRCRSSGWRTRSPGFAQLDGGDRVAAACARIPT